MKIAGQMKERSIIRPKCQNFIEKNCKSKLPLTFQKAEKLREPFKRTN